MCYTPPRSFEENSQMHTSIPTHFLRRHMLPPPITHSLTQPRTHHHHLLPRVEHNLFARSICHCVFTNLLRSKKKKKNQIAKRRGRCRWRRQRREGGSMFSLQRRRLPVHYLSQPPFHPPLLPHSSFEPPYSMLVLLLLACLAE